MATDPSFAGFPGFGNGFRVNDQTASLDSNQVQECFINMPSQDLNFLENPLLPPDQRSGDLDTPITVGRGRGAYASGDADSLTLPSMGTSGPGNSPSCDSEYVETGLRFIGQILLEENIEDKPCLLYDPLGLQVTEKSFYDAIGEKYPPSPYQNRPPPFISPNIESPLGPEVTEKSFYDAIGEKYPPSPNQNRPPPWTNHNFDCPDDIPSGSSCNDYMTSSSSCTNDDPRWFRDHAEDKSSFLEADVPGKFIFRAKGSELSADRSHKMTKNIGDGTKLLAQSIFTRSESPSQFRNGLEKACHFFPRGIQLESAKVLPEWKRKDQKWKGEKENLREGSTGRKNHERENIDFQEYRSVKQSAVSVEESNLLEMFDDALSELCGSYRSLLNKERKSCQPPEEPHEEPQGATGGKYRADKKGEKTNRVDLSALLLQCAQSVSAGDRRASNDLLKQIRLHSSPFGDGCQRMAHFFANGLEARLAGTGVGTQLFYSSFASKRISASEILRAYKVQLSACPFKKILLTFAVNMIYKAADKATSLHIIDFGIQYGLPWPILIYKLSTRAGGPPKLRITGIEVPEPGFHPTEQIEDTGHRLGKYCERFNVPFEYHALASKNWETIRIENLKIDRNEMLAVNCLFRFMHLPDETVEEKSPRNEILNLIRKMNPGIFVHSTVNGSHNGPFFVQRFREALFHFSAVYDIYDAAVPRDSVERLMIEREFSGREAMNVIACEGSERVERPETYKQWQVRITRAGFRQLPLDRELVGLFGSMLKERYQKDFVLEKDNHWLLQGWKGRIIYASGCWVPV